MRITWTGALIFMGYVLVYAAFHNGGAYALEPWTPVYRAT